MLIRRQQRLTLLLCPAVLLAGCGSREQHQPPPPAPTSTSAEESDLTVRASRAPVTTSPNGGSSSEAARRALDAYRGMWHELTAAAASANHHSTGLSVHTSGQALTDIRGLLYTDSIAGNITLGLPVLAPRVKEVRIPEVPIEVDIIDCVDVSRWRKHKARGGLADPTATHRIAEATARNNDGKWKVISFSLREVTAC
ncbi:hypothetical protein M8C13_08880 [Crossiella sp. SN42]|uniref:hypothetical protein n=1 Tax=Crossiella sp. SN42 TaxID=2944808 RepID=UPI00207C3190|nr:hypothetical protein [Crossiella sp. SN42]MCO1575870.1 hypothetical protein [Crossiella sp. SN42]